MESQPPTESIPYDIVIAEMEARLHHLVSENTMLGARIRFRDKEIESLREELAKATLPRAE